MEGELAEIASKVGYALSAYSSIWLAVVYSRGLRAVTQLLEKGLA
jgi:hypothetical protein